MPDIKNKWQGGVLAPDGAIYAIPSDADSVVRCRLTPGCPPVDCACYQLLKLQCDGALSNSAFSFNLRRYNLVLKIVPATGEVSCVGQLEVETG